MTDEQTAAAIVARCVHADGPMQSKCIVWTGAKVAGYGAVRINGKMWKTHRAMWQAVNGTIPDGMLVCHKCDVPSCVNIEHLFIGTQADNSADMVRKGRSVNCGSGNVGFPGEKNGRAKLSGESVAEIMATLGQTGQLAKKHGVDRTTIQKIRRGERWKCLREAAEAAKEGKA